MRIENCSILRSLCLPLLCIVLTLSASNAARADSVQITGDTDNSLGGLGDFFGSLTYTPHPICGNWGTLSISLTNTSDPHNGGYITGFLFNIDSTDYFAKADMEYTPPPTHPFAACYGLGLVALPSLPVFDAGAALAGSFYYWPGEPTQGIGVGETGVFNMKIIANDAQYLTVDDFWAPQGRSLFNFIVGFRAFNGGGADIVPAMRYVMPPPPVVPLPAPVALGAVGLLGVAIYRVKFRRSA